MEIKLQFYGMQKIKDSNYKFFKVLFYILGHEDEIFSCAFNYEGDIIITGSKDNTCRIWVDNDFNKWLIC